MDGPRALQLADRASERAHVRLQLVANQGFTIVGWQSLAFAGLPAQAWPLSLPAEAVQGTHTNIAARLAFSLAWRLTQIEACQEMSLLEMERVNWIRVHGNGRCSYGQGRTASSSKLEPAKLHSPAGGEKERKLIGISSLTRQWSRSQLGRVLVPVSSN